MTWPDLTEFHEAISSPKRAFKDPALQAASIEKDRFGMPKPSTGANAVVYRATTADGRAWAIRCFLRPITDHAERYAAISKHLLTLNPEFTCHFDFITEGIKVKGKWYPVLKMEWVGGKLLHLYVEQALKTAASGSIQVLRDQWRELMTRLELAEIAHGDLQQGNVLVPNDRFLLIDYDGMWVPKLRGKKGFEIGHRAFQHPGRTENDFGFYLDRFSGLVVYLSLSALALRPALWAEFHNGDNLIFVQDDFLNPGATALWTSLEALKSPRIDYLSRTLRDLLKRPPAAIPNLEQVLHAAPSDLPAWLKT